MILTALNDYYQRLRDDEDTAIAPPGYSQEKISFAIVLDSSGAAVDVTPILGNGDKIGKMMQVPASFKRPGTASKAFFLWDKTSYSLGVGVDTKKPPRTPDAFRTRLAHDHAAFRKLHEGLLTSQTDDGLLALLAFLEAWKPDWFESHRVFQRHAKSLPNSNVVFRLDGEQRFLHERPAARALWARQTTRELPCVQGVCLVTGETSDLVRLHPTIKGVKDAQSSGADLVSFNLNSFESYGKKQGYNAPISGDAAFAYTTAISHLLRRSPDNRQRLQIGDTTVVFWAQAADKASAEQGENLLAAFFDPRDDDKQATQALHDVLNQVRSGLPLRELGKNLDDVTQIFVLGLAPNRSRLSIRFWERDTLGHFAKRLTDHFDDLELQPPPWRRPPSPGWLAMAAAPIHGGNAKANAVDIPPLLAGELTRAVLSGSRYPRSLLTAMVMRFRADGHVTGIRVALCKAVLARHHRLTNSQGVPPREPRYYQHRPRLSAGPPVRHS